ncbi:MAG: VCBS domain-containing protein, partial [Pseudomonadota bacterium]
MMAGDMVGEKGLGLLGGEAPDDLDTLIGADWPANVTHPEASRAGQNPQEQSHDQSQNQSEPGTANGFVFTIVNTNDDGEVATLENGDALDLSDLPARWRGIKADYVGDGVAGDDDGSIQFALYDADGKLVEERTENRAPFALFGDRNGDFTDPSTPLLDGYYRLEVIAFSQNGARGVELASTSISFTVTSDGPPPQGESAFEFKFVDTNSNEDVATFADGDSIDLSDLASGNRGITANFVSDGDFTDDDGSIRFELRDSDGNLLEERTENALPFALFGDRGGDYRNPHPALADGTYSLTVIATDRNGGRGQEIGRETISFTVTSDRLPPQGESAFEFKFVDTDSDVDVATFADGDTIDLSDLAPGKRGITANFVSDGDTTDDDGSIRFELRDSDGNLLEERTENVLPFALFGDRGGDYRNPHPALADGTYTLTVIATDRNGGRGQEIGRETITFTIESDDILAPVDLAVVFDASEIEEANGETTGTVTRTGDTSEPLVVTLSLSDPNELNVPMTIEIEAGRSSAHFLAIADDDPLNDGDQVVTITASAPGANAGSATLTVLDDDEPPVDNLAPVVTPLTFGPFTEDDGVITLDLLQGQTDPDGDDDLLTISTSFGTDNGDGTVSFDTGTFNSLPADDGIVSTIAYSVIDDQGAATLNQFTLTVNGVNDVAILGGDTDGQVTEDDQLSASGTLTIDDPDADEAAFQPQDDTEGDFGTFSLAANGNWSYQLDNDNPAVQALTNGETLSETFTVTSIDGTTQDVTITINGVDEGQIGAAPVALDFMVNGFIPTDIILDASSVDIVADLASDADTDLNSQSISFTSATINGQETTVEAVGVTYVPGDGDAGGFITDTNAVAYDGLSGFQTADVVITYTVTDGTFTDEGELTFTVVGVPGDFDVNLRYAGENVAGDVLRADADVGPDEALADIEFAGPNTLKDLAEDATILTTIRDFVTNPPGDSLSIAYALAENDSQATAFVDITDEVFTGAAGGVSIAIDGTFASSFTDTSSLAIIRGQDGPSVSATALNGSSVDADYLGGSGGSVRAEDGSVANGLFSGVLATLVQVGGTTGEFGAASISGTAGEAVEVPFGGMASGMGTDTVSTAIIGFPEGTTFSDGTPNSTGTEVVFDGLPPAGFTFTTPADAEGEFDIRVFASDDMLGNTNVQIVIPVTLDAGMAKGAAPVAADIDFGIVADINAIFTVSDVALIDGFASDADSDLDADDISLISVTIDGQDVSLADAGFTLTPGTGDAGSFTIDSTGPIFAGLAIGQTAEVLITFSVTDGDQSDTGTLRYVIESRTNDLEGVYDLPDEGILSGTLTLAGDLAEGETATAEAMAGANEIAEAVTITGGLGFVEALTPDAEGDTGLDRLLESFLIDGGGDPLPDDAMGLDVFNVDLDAIDLTAFDGFGIASAVAVDGASATSDVTGDAGAFSIALFGAEADSAATDQSFALARGADVGSSAVATAVDSSVVDARAESGSEASAFAAQTSTASADAENNSDALAFAANTSTATASAETMSSASAGANEMSIAFADAVDGSTVVAIAQNSAEALNFAAFNSVALAIADDGSIAESIALDQSATTAWADVRSDSSALAETASAAKAQSINDGFASASATFMAASTASAADASTALASATNFGEGAADALTAEIADDVTAAKAAVDAAVNTVAVDGTVAADALASLIDQFTPDFESVTPNTMGATATASDGSVATAEAANESVATADAESFSGTAGEATMIAPFAGADDMVSPVQTVVYSGFPEGTTFSDGTPSADGTSVTFTGPAPEDFAFTAPASFEGAFTLTITATDGDDEAVATQTVSIEPGTGNGPVAAQAEIVFGTGLDLAGIERVSEDASGTEGNSSSFSAVFSPDGTKVAFESAASNLVGNGTNGLRDVFVKDLITGTVTRVSETASGTGGNNTVSQNAIFSPDGTKVAFESRASNLVAGDTNETEDVFIKDLITGTLTLVSETASGTGGNGLSRLNRDGVFSPDGTKVVFESAANN